MRPTFSGLHAILAPTALALAIPAITSCGPDERLTKAQALTHAEDRVPTELTPAAGPLATRAPTDYRLLEFTSDYGRAFFKNCELTLLLPQYDNTARTRVKCIINTPEDRLFEAEHQFTSEETTALWGMVEAADLFGSGHVGADHRESDGVLSILVVSKPGASAALVVSYNPTFENPGPRKELEDWLEDHRSKLWDEWLEHQTAPAS